MEDNTLSPEVQRLANAFIVTLYNIECLIDKGILEGPKLLSDKGRAEAIKLTEEGFICTQEEVNIVMNHFMSGGPAPTVH